MEATMLRTIAILVAAVLATSAQVGQSFPHTNKNGRATIEYRHQGLAVVANYDYSQKNHDGPWLLIDVALGSTNRFVLHRRNFTLVTADGQKFPLASQEQGAADSENINLLIQNAKIYRQNLDSYFSQRNRHEPIRFFSLPFSRSISDEAIVDNDRVAIGPLLFRSPDGAWKEGTLRLVLSNEKANAELPITLQ
jgi:hypothetical protein